MDRPTSPCDTYRPTGGHWCRCHHAHRPQDCPHGPPRRLTPRAVDNMRRAVAVALGLIMLYCVAGIANAQDPSAVPGLAQASEIAKMVAGTVTVTNWGGGYLDFYPSGCGTITIHPNSGFAKRDEQHNIYFAKMAWSFYAEMAFVDYAFDYKLTEGDTDCP